MPAAGATNVSPAANVTATFSEAMNGAGMKASFKLHKGTGRVPTLFLYPPNPKPLLMRGWLNRARPKRSKARA